MPPPRRLSQSRLLANAAALFALGPVLVGLLGLVTPRTVLAAAFGFELPFLPADQRLVDSLMRLFSIRDVFLGGATLSAWYNGDRKTLGTIMLLGAGVVFTDGAVNDYQIGSGAWKHWGVVPVMVFIGVGLLGWLDRRFAKK